MYEKKGKLLEAEQKKKDDSAFLHVSVQEEWTDRGA